MSYLWKCLLIIFIGFIAVKVVESDSHSYYGCFDRTSIDYYNSSYLINLSVCITNCTKSTVISVSRHSCYCLKSLPEGSGNLICDHPCPYNNNTTCGGNGSLSVYNLTVTTTTPTTSTASTTTTTTTITTTTRTETSTNTKNGRKQTTSHIYLFIGLGVLVILIVVVTVFIGCISSRRRKSSEANSLNTSNNLNTLDGQNDYVVNTEVGEADDAYDRLNGKCVNFYDPTYHHLRLNNMGGACLLTGSEYSHTGECVKANNKIAAIDFDTYSHVHFNKEGEVEIKAHMNSNQARKTDNETVAIDIDPYSNVSFNKEDGIEIIAQMSSNQAGMTNNKRVAIDIDPYSNAHFNKGGVELNAYMSSNQAGMSNNKIEAIDIDPYSNVPFNEEEGINLNAQMASVIDSDNSNHGPFDEEGWTEENIYMNFKQTSMADSENTAISSDAYDQVDYERGQPM